MPIQNNISQLKQFFDVEPEKQYEDKLFLKLKEGNLFIWFSQGKCISGSWGAWNVDEGTIISLTFYPKKRRKPSAYRFNKEEMKQGYNSGHPHYKSDEKGLYYSTQFGKVTRINFIPASKYENLRCNESKVILTK